MPAWWQVGREGVTPLFSEKASASTVDEELLSFQEKLGTGAYCAGYGSALTLDDQLKVAVLLSWHAERHCPHDDAIAMLIPSDMKCAHNRRPLPVAGYSSRGA